MSRFISLLLVLIFFIAQVPLSLATPQACQNEVSSALDTIMGVPNKDELHGYLKQLSDLMSTNQASYLLVDQVEQLARDAHLEVTGVCAELSRFSNMSDFYVAAYRLPSCKALSSEDAEIASQLDILTFCEDRSSKLLDTFLDRISDYLLKQAVRTSMDPMVQKMRSLNSRLSVLISEYSRLINNFFTFNFRLGDAITGDVD